MKYSDSNPPIQCLMTQSTCYRQTGRITPVGVLWHSTGANNPTIKRYVQPDDNAKNKADLIALIGKNYNGNDWNHISHQAGVNAWIGKLASGAVSTVQTLPWDFKPWGCGSGSKGSCNNGWIQFEICEDALNDANYFSQVYKEACELTAYLCKKFGINPNGTVTYNGVKVPTILCHADSHTLKLGSNHGDVLHWFPKFGKSMVSVRSDVAVLLNGSTPAPAPVPSDTVYRVRKTWEDSKSQIGAFTVLSNATAFADKNPGYTVFDGNGKAVYPVKVTTPYVVRVTIPDLIIREGAGIDTHATGKFTGTGVFTIVEEKSGQGSAKGWGKLKSGAGWISLDFAEKV